IVAKLWLLVLGLSAFSVAQARDAHEQRARRAFATMDAEVVAPGVRAAALRELASLCEAGYGPACTMAARMKIWLEEGAAPETVRLRQRGCQLGERAACGLVGPPWGNQYTKESIEVDKATLEAACQSGPDNACIRWSDTLITPGAPQALV